MDFSKLAQDVLAFAGERGILSADLSETEKNLQVLVMELGQQAFQFHLDQDKKRGYEGSSRLCECGQGQKFVDHRSRTIDTLFGALTYSRAYYHCSHCGKGTFPFDLAQGLGKRRVSVALAQLLTELAESMPFREASLKFQKFLGRSLSASTINRIAREVGLVAARMEEEAAEKVQANRHEVEALEAGRLYSFADGAMVHRTDGWHEVKACQCRWQDAKGNWHVRRLCRNEEAEKFARLAWACMHVCGLDNARESVLIGDGIPWIWNHLGPIADEAVQIVDWYHAKEHLWDTAKALFGEGSPECQAFGQLLETLLWESQHEQLHGTLQEKRKSLRSTGKREAIDQLLGYLKRHQGRMDYRKYRDAGLLIGSGPIEGDCKNLIHARMKRGSPRWSKEGCQSMLSLRCCHANNQQSPLWQRKPLLAA